MYGVLNLTLIVTHIATIIFILFGWIPSKFRRLHFYVVATTAFSWFVLGLKYGFGYCFLTDWHWMVRRKSGILDDPNSFIKLLIDSASGRDVSSVFIDTATAVVFVAVFAVSVYVNFVKRKSLAG